MIRRIGPDEKLARIRVLSCDVDGVLTDGGLYYDDKGGELRRYHVLDGLGMQALQRAGIVVCMISRSSTPSIQHRARTLGIAHCLTGVAEKLPALLGVLSRLGVSLEETAHVGDDVNDLELLESVGVPISVANAVAEVQAQCHFITAKGGGNGAVREIAEAILKSRNLRVTA
jgi:3-deoxy-D-manno-octulosonate 8-phosphate phosphatase (KDO 8-P phosphatase)